MRFAVIGGGPKAAALAAKVMALQKCSEPAPQIDVFEERRSGGNWSGLGGYTDGLQELCTPALRDLGFPYTDPLKAVNECMLAEFSWPAFLLSLEYMDPNEAAIRPFYHEWIARGQHSPRHDLLSVYVRWALRKAQAECSLVSVHEETSVTGIDHRSGKWIVQFASSGDTTSREIEVDRVVLTGVKPPRKKIQVSGRKSEVFDGCSYWETSIQRKIEKLAKKAADGSTLPGSNLTALIVGGGGTSAAIALDLAQTYPSLSIKIIGSDAFIKSRPSSFWSDILHSDENSWRSLDKNQKEHFVNTFVKGSVWSKIADNLQKFRTVEYSSGRVDFKKAQGRLTVTGLPMYTLTLENRSETHEGNIVIQASGFDYLWCDRLFTGTLQPFRRVFAQLRGLEAMVGDDFSFSFSSPATGSFPDGLHLPMLGAYINPSAPTLMSLGSVSGAILDRIVLT